jgi:hypothetical protein
MIFKNKIIKRVWNIMEFDCSLFSFQGSLVSIVYLGSKPGQLQEAVGTFKGIPAFIPGLRPTS